MITGTSVGKFMMIYEMLLKLQVCVKKHNKLVF